MSSTTEFLNDSVLLVGIGNAISYYCAGALTFVLFYGIFVLLYAQSTWVYLKNKQSHRARIWMFLISTTNFLLSTAFAAAQIATIRIYIYSTLLGYQDMPLMKRLSLQHGQLEDVTLVILWTGSFQVIISDGIVIWRACVLLRGSQWLKILQLILLLGAVASRVVYVLGGLHKNTLFIPIALGLSVGTNAVSTALIGYVSWYHRKEMAIGLGRHRPTSVERVLVLLVESGVLFCLLQTAFGALALTYNSGVDTAGSSLHAIFISIFYGFSAMYPTLVTTLVDTHRTIGDMYSTDISHALNHELDSDPITTLQFVQGDAVSSIGTLSQKTEENNDTQTA